MSDIGDDFAALKEANKEKKECNKLQSTRLLMDKGVAFDVKNWGSHLVVYGESEAIDFWPSTGKFITRKTDKKGRGIFNLLKHCRV